MNQGRTVFSQLISFLPDREFRRCVQRYQADLRLRGFTCWDQYLAMAFAQLTYRESLRDIEACLGSLQGKLYDLGFHGKVARSTLADANESRDWLPSRCTLCSTCAATFPRLFALPRARAMTKNGD